MFSILMTFSRNRAITPNFYCLAKRFIQVPALTSDMIAWRDKILANQTPEQIVKLKSNKQRLLFSIPESDLEENFNKGFGPGG